MYHAVRVVGLVVACILLSAQNLPGQVDPVKSSQAYLSQKLVSISKATSPTAAQAQLKAEKKFPGWKVVNIKELSKTWSITMKKA
jgi:hypothetical protein